MTQSDAWIPLAEVARPHGVRGELRLKLYNKTSDVLLHQDEVLVRLPTGEEHEVSIDGARRADDAILMKLFSVDTRDRAEELRGSILCVRRSAFPPPEQGEYYTVDLLGCEVRLGGARLGEVVDVVSYPTATALVVSADDGLGAWEVPLSEAFVGRIEPSARLVELSTLEDLERLPAKKAKKTRRAERPDEGSAEGPDEGGAERPDEGAAERPDEG